MILTLTVLMSASVIYSSPIPPEPFKIIGKNLQEVKPDYKVTKFTFTRDNDTDVMDQDVPNLQLIPLDFLCEFCQVVIIKLKERQATEDDFEEKIRSECQNSTSDDSSSLCDVINRVNLDRLRKEQPKEICDSQNMCKGGDAGPPATSPEHTIGGEGEKEKDTETEHFLTVDQKDVNATLLVEDVAAPY